MINSYGNPYLPPDKPAAMSFSAAAELPAAIEAEPKTAAQVAAKNPNPPAEDRKKGQRKERDSGSSRKTTSGNKKAAAGGERGERNQKGGRARGSRQYAEKPARAKESNKPAPVETASSAPAKPARKNGPPLSPSKMSYAEMARAAAEKQKATTST